MIRQTLDNAKRPVPDSTSEAPHGSSFERDLSNALASGRIEPLLRGAHEAIALPHRLRLIDIEARHRLAQYRSHYNPNQPRVPAGHPDGGQWTAAGGYGTRLAAADNLYRRVLQIDPRDAHAQAGLLGLRAAQTDPVSAESRLKGLIASDSTESVLYFSLGNQYAQQHRWAEAQQAFAKAAAMDPENADYAYYYAVSLEQMKQSAAALQQYRLALTLGLRRTSSFDPATAQARVQALSR